MSTKYIKNDYSKIFLEKANEIHGIKYDYSAVEYSKSQRKVKIICMTHGEFEQTPQCHMRGQGCPKCSKQSDKYKSYTFDEFVASAHKAHSNKYVYTDDNFRGATHKIKIICPDHGEFEQRPYIHLRSTAGCPRCNGKQVTTSDFINKANTVHNSKYTYLKTNYINNRVKIIITCSIHGDFEQTPGDHLSGCGCQQCGIDSMVNLKTKSHKEFVQGAMFKTGNEEMVYWFDTYKGDNIKYSFYCPKCTSIYESTPNNHLNGTGCSQCAIMEKTYNWLSLYQSDHTLGNAAGLFYKIKFRHKTKNLEFIKVGITKNSIKERYSDKHYKEFEYEILKIVETTILEAAKMEKLYLQKNIHNRYELPLDVKFCGRTECFKVM